MKVTLNGTDITNAFAVRENGRYEGLVDRPHRGQERADRATRAPRNAHWGKFKNRNGIGRQITIRNHPIGGPVFAGPQVHTVLLQSERLEPAARCGDRWAVQCADQGGAPLSEHRHAGAVRRVRPRQSAAGSVDRPDDHRRREDGALHRPARHRDCGSRHLPDCGAGRPEQADRAVVDHAAVEPQALLPVRWRLREPAHPDRAGQRPPGDAARARLRGGDLEPEHLREQLQRPRLGRGGDDDEGDRDRAVRRRSGTRLATAVLRRRCSSICSSRTTRACSTG